MSKNTILRIGAAFGLAVISPLSAEQPKPFELTKTDALAPGEMTSFFEVDLSTNAVQVELLKANGQLFSGAPVGEIAAGVQPPFIAINGDFFEEDFSPTGMLVTNGMIWKGPCYPQFTSKKPRSVFSMDVDRNVFIGQPDFSFTLENDAGGSLRIDHINFATRHDQSTLYTSVFGARSAPLLASQTQVVLELSEPEILPNKRTAATIKNVGPGPTAELSILSVVLHLPKPLPDWVKSGATVSLNPKLANLPGKVVFIVGGLPRILDQGTIDIQRFAKEEDFPESVATGKYPRTAIGYNSKAKRLFVLVTNGYINNEQGLTLQQVAEYFQAQGCENALNLDGGSSSTIVANHALINVPGRYDKTPYPVGSALIFRQQPGKVNH